MFLYVQQTREKTLITSLDLITFNKTYYKSKKKINGKCEYYSYLEDYLGITKWSKMTLVDEVYANLQYRKKGTKNRIVHIIPTHEGHRKDFVKKKRFKRKKILKSIL